MFPIIAKLPMLNLLIATKKKIFTQKLFLEKGIGYGDFFIPSTLETGNYKLIGYTNWMLNKSNSDYFNIDISIINPYQISNNIEEKNVTKIQKQTEKTTNNINISTNKTTYSNREIVNLEIQSNIIEESLKGSYSVSVRKIDSFSLKKKLNPIDFIKSKKNPTTDISFNTEKSIIPEFRGEIISGKIISKLSSNVVENKNISLSIPGQNYAFQITKTNKNGEFIFNLDNAYTNPNIVIQIIDSDKENYKIEINNTKSPDYSSLTFNELKLNPELKKVIEEKSIASQIENAYYNNKKDSLISTKSKRKFYNFPSKEYILDDYTRFPTLKETVIEIVEEMYYKTIDNNYTLHVYDYNANRGLQIPTLVIVNGLIIQDINELFQHKADNIYKIDIVRGGYYFGTKLYNGIIEITTKKHDYETMLNGDFIIKPNILRPLEKKEYYKPNYTSDLNSRIPDYRYQLLWQPEVKLEKKEQTISFFTSDIIGDFEITIEGFSDTGIPVYASTIIKVK